MRSETCPQAVTTNPQFSVIFREKTRATVFAPIKGESLRITEVVKADEPKTFDLVKEMSTKTAVSELNLTDRQRQRLFELGILISEHKRPSQVWFSPSLRNTRELIPLRPFDSENGVATHERLIVNPTFQYLDVERWDQEVTVQIPGGHDFLRWGSWVKIQETSASIPCIYWISPGERELLSSFVAGAAPPTLADEENRRRLCAAEILVTPESVKRWQKARNEKLFAAWQQFGRSLYTVWRGLIHPLQVAAICEYYRQLIGEGYVSLGDAQVARRYAIQNEPVSCYLHRQLTGLVQQVAGERVKPTYAYFSSYQPGAILRPHLDRRQCEYSVSLLVDYMPEPQDVSPWPLFLKELGRDGRTVPINLGLGDAVLYKGRELMHYRDALPLGHCSSSIFFHYVRQDFSGSLN